MVLGPSRWLDSGRPGAPLEGRRGIARALRSRGIPAVVMEDERQGAGETNTALFTRLLRRHDVRNFVVHWPLGARLHGWEKEAGDLLRWLHDGVLSPQQVYLLAPTQRVGIDEGAWALSEPGNRTRYHDDFLAYGVAVRVWDDETALAYHLAAVAWELRASDAPRWHDALHLDRPASPP